jgi:hypothetical protein
VLEQMRKRFPDVIPAAGRAVPDHAV